MTHKDKPAKQHTAYLVHTDGRKEEVKPKNGTDFSLEELQVYVGGYIQVINLGRSEVMVINEEGKLKNLPTNGEASFIAHMRKAIFTFDRIVGNAVVCHKSMVK